MIQQSSPTQQPQQTGPMNNFVNNQKDRANAVKKTAISMAPMAASLGGAALSGIGMLGGATGLLSPTTTKWLTGLGTGALAVGKMAGVAKAIPGAATQAKQTYGNIRQQQLAARGQQSMSQPR